MPASRGTSTLWARYRFTSYRYCAISWRRTSYSGWKCSASLVPQGKRLTRWGWLQNYWMCVAFHYLFLSKKSILPEPGLTNPQYRQRLPPLRNCILRSHKHICATHLSLCSSLIPPNVDRTRDVRTICPSLDEGHTWVTGLVGAECYHGVPRRIQGRGCMVAVQQIHRGRQNPSRGGS